MPSALSSFTDCIARELAAVDDRFHGELTSDLKCVNTLVKHVSRFRGKMLRPCLVLLSGKACESNLGLETTAKTAVPNSEAAPRTTSVGA